MKKKLYYVVEKSIINIDGVMECDGYKDISVYEIVNNEPQVFFTLNLLLEENTIDYIQDYLDDNGYGDDEFEFVQL